MLAIPVVRLPLSISFFLSVSVAHWRAFIGVGNKYGHGRIYVAFYLVGPIRAGLLARGRHVFLSFYALSIRPELILESAQCHRYRGVLPRNFYYEIMT